MAAPEPVSAELIEPRRDEVGAMIDSQAARAAAICAARSAPSLIMMIAGV
jgi:hypothetical protein